MRVQPRSYPPPPARRSWTAAARNTAAAARPCAACALAVVRLTLILVTHARRDLHRGGWFRAARLGGSTTRGLGAVARQVRHHASWPGGAAGGWVLLAAAGCCWDGSEQRIETPRKSRKSTSRSSGAKCDSEQQVTRVPLDRPGAVLNREKATGLASSAV
jgi:hypothetical protein